MYLNQHLSPGNAAAADPSQPPAKLTPEVVIEQLRAIRAQMPEITPITPSERTVLARRAQTSPAVLQASINVIGASDNIAAAVGQPIGDVQAMQAESNRWTTVEDELRTLLNGVSGANLARRERLALIAAQAYTIGAQLARDPAHKLLVPHVREIKRLKRIERQKKTAPAETPAPLPQAPVPAPPLPAPQHLLDTPEVKA